MRDLSPTTLYRYGVRTGHTRRAHAQETAEWRRTRAERAFPPDVREMLLADVATGASVRLAAERLGLRYQAVYAWCRWDPEFGRRLDEAQRAAAPEGCPHGTEAGYRQWRCRCAECRAGRSR